MSIEIKTRKNGQEKRTKAITKLPSGGLFLRQSFLGSEIHVIAVRHCTEYTNETSLFPVNP